MPALLETQASFLTRDKTCNLVPPQLKNESCEAYHARLACLYHLKPIDVTAIMQAQ